MENENFVTVVTVGNDDQGQHQPQSDSVSSNSGYVTVLTIGNQDDIDEPKTITEEVLVYRLPGERLGFGLKFEGGTKASEFVKRLFIQSCAPDSPASRVTSSWGRLSEGDEVLEIDNIAVNNMTRIDCVRCLKDSNVVIKLLVQHFVQTKQSEQRARSVEDIPFVIGTEKKRTPPPPPPVPPRKIPRKLFKHHSLNGKSDLQENQENPVPLARQFPNESSKLRNSGRFHSPDVPRRDRRFSDGSVAPPDAEVYVDLFSQGSTQSLSESDDTGSTISTVIDRFGSFPATTTSSFAGSLPSTPTAVQKQLDLSNLLNAYDEEELITSNKHISNSSKEQEKSGSPLLPPSCFQDAPLSYGNEDMRINEDEVDFKKRTIPKVETIKINSEDKLFRKPPVPPRSRDTNDFNKKTIHDENMNISNLPRLVDFVPKTSTKQENIDNPIEIMKLFLETERRGNNNILENECVSDRENLYDDIYNSKWSLSPQLATIGEVEEEGSQEFQINNRSTNKSTPIVIVENADCETDNKIVDENTNDRSGSKEIDGNMEIPPSDSRQPPDGHEFPDYMETNSDPSIIKKKENEMEVKLYKITECINLSQTPSQSSLNEFSSTTTNLLKTNSMSNNDLRSRQYTTDDIKFIASLQMEPKSNLHHRSQSLIDMSTLSKQKNDKWNLLAEQRKKGLSKLKGLVIPEQISETETTPVVNLPEIKSNNFTPTISQQENFIQPIQISTDTKPSPLTTLSWSTNNLLPKYSPAFKRKTLQIYPTIKSSVTNKPKSLKTDQEDQDPPKSLESITSPTRSDCSFDYVNCSQKKSLSKETKIKETEDCTTKVSTKDLTRSEDESDNDSALSSSQSSYASRCSPPSSPTNDYDNLDDKFNSQCRLLKPSSVEAINRKNILASAKCRSGRDLKVGSPVIRRKYEEMESSPQQDLVQKEIVDVKEITNGSQEDAITPPKQQNPDSVKTLHKLIDAQAGTKTVVREISRSEYLRSNRDSKPLSVNALRRNFESVVSKPLLPPQPVFKPVDSKITRTETKVITNNSKINNNNNSNNNLNDVVTKHQDDNKIETVSPKIELPVKKQLEEKNNVQEVKTTKIIFNVESVGTSLGITLAGGMDYENKDVTVHRIRYGSVAYQDGRLKRGDKIVSINGKSTKHLTHDEATNLLKQPVSKFIIEVEECKEVPLSTTRRRSSVSSVSEPKNSVVPVSSKKPNHIITYEKGVGGFGFSIEGGKDSLQGDVPLIIKKIFQGGAADQCGKLFVGDELIAINDVPFCNLSRIESWTLMKKIPDGIVNIHIYR